MKASTFLSEYFRQISGYPILDEEHEKKLRVRILEGSDEEKEDARNTLVLSHLRYAWNVAMEAAVFGGDAEDLLQSANTALVEASKRFDPKRGVRFGTYALSWMRTCISRTLLRDMPIKVSVHVNERMLKLRAETARMEAACGRTPTEEELSDCLGWELSSVRELRSYLKAMEVLHVDDLPDVSQVFGKSLSGAEDHFFQPESAAMDLETGSEIEKILDDRLSKPEKYVLGCRYFSRPAKTYEQVGTEFSLSRESVRRIERKALRKLMYA